jgi:predicted RecB family nuclease
MATSDDLKVIRGIGPNLERRLHGAGIHTFQQLAELSVEQLEAMPAAAPFQACSSASLCCSARAVATTRPDQSRYASTPEINHAMSTASNALSEGANSG